MSKAEKFSFANEDHLNLFIGLLVHQGAMCPKCGYGTRVTSKRWAKCKRCGERVERLAFPQSVTPNEQ